MTRNVLTANSVDYAIVGKRAPVIDRRTTIALIVIAARAAERIDGNSDLFAVARIQTAPYESQKHTNVSKHMFVDYVINPACWFQMHYTVIFAFAVYVYTVRNYGSKQHIINSCI